MIFVLKLKLFDLEDKVLVCNMKAVVHSYKLYFNILLIMFSTYIFDIIGMLYSDLGKLWEPVELFQNMWIGFISIRHYFML